MFIVYIFSAKLSLVSLQKHLKKSNQITLEKLNLYLNLDFKSLYVSKIIFSINI